MSDRMDGSDDTEQVARRDASGRVIRRVDHGSACLLFPSPGDNDYGAPSLTRMCSCGYFDAQESRGAGGEPSVRWGDDFIRRATKKLEEWPEWVRQRSGNTVPTTTPTPSSDREETPQ